MKHHEAVTTILNRWLAQWPALSSNVPSIFDNESAGQASTYAHLRIRSLESERHTIGGDASKRMRRNGLIVVTINTPPNTGRIAADRLAQHVRTIFEEQRLSFAAGEDIVAAECSISEGVDSGSFWSVLCTVKFWFYE